ncbi:prenyltransferase/squalene oxidase repeat-containing protein [Streptomyces sp. NPDC048484]|uniref:prenyltransferase/squalene oxidase repeat-containing protein n=1 Tax=Streptomyces sp. NPDC048484 TaxID=3155146 RepID=UPI003440F414
MTTLPVKLDDVLESATAYCLATQTDAGAWETEPDPRVTETALMWCALSPLPDAPSQAAAGRARKWLMRAAPQRHHPAAEAFEGALRSLVLDRDGAIDIRSSVFDDPVVASRARLLQVIATHRNRVVLGGSTPTTLREALAHACAQAETARFKPWTRTEYLSARALLEAHLGCPAQARETTEALCRDQSPDGMFHANPITTALALLALTATMPRSRAWRRAHHGVLRAQRPDGTWRFCTSDVWDATLTVRAFKGIPQFDRQGLAPAVRFLRRVQNDDGGWSFRSGTESDNDTTSAALIALAGLPEVPDAVTGRALAYLAQRRTPDGLWRTWQHLQDPPTEDVVAHAVTALDRYDSRHSVGVEDARRWLVGRWKSTGRWTASWYRGLPYSVLEVSSALHDRAILREVGEDLLTAQNDDGGWPAEPGGDSLPSATGLALAALDRCGVEHAHARRGGLGYLADSQCGDGTWPGMPEMVGPRPLLTHYQTQTHAFVAMGLRTAFPYGPGGR